jgi:hypothetical protein
MNQRSYSVRAGVAVHHVLDAAAEPNELLLQ